MTDSQKLNKLNFPAEKRVRFFGANMDLLTMQETLEHIEDIIQRRVITQHVVVNVAKLVMMQKDAQLRRIVNACPLINVDGQGIVWGARLLGYPVPERVAGIDLFVNVVALCAQKKYRPFFLGAQKEVVDAVARIFKDRHPRLQVAGVRDGYFSAQEEPALVEQIKQSKADVLFVAMGSPQKEVFLSKYVDTMGVPFVMGVGGSFDVVAGVVKRAPLWMQKTGMEWFYRLMCEPRRMWKRYLTTNAIYLGMLIKGAVNRKYVMGHEKGSDTLKNL